MPLVRVLAPTAVLAASLLLGACGGGDDSASIDAGYNCTIEQRDEEFLAGMEKVGAKGMTIRLVSSNPAPPARGDNLWVLEVEDGAGAVDDGAVQITTFMPDHQHNGVVDEPATPDPAVDGRYSFDRVNMWMPGVWEITIEATPAGGTAADTDFVVFRFCIPS